MPFVLLVFFLCMSHEVGEVTYVELFKDAEGKSRVSDVDQLTARGFKCPPLQYIFIYQVFCKALIQGVIHVCLWDDMLVAASYSLL